MLTSITFSKIPANLFFKFYLFFCILSYQIPSIVHDRTSLLDVSCSKLMCNFFFNFIQKNELIFSELSVKKKKYLGTTAILPHKDIIVSL